MRVGEHPKKPVCGTEYHSGRQNASLNINRLARPLSDIHEFAEYCSVPCFTLDVQHSMRGIPAPTRLPHYLWERGAGEAGEVDSLAGPGSHNNNKPVHRSRGV